MAHQEQLWEDYGKEGGYIWISYEDGYLLHNEECPNYAVVSARVPKVQKRYMLDEFGPVSLVHPEGNTFTLAGVYEFGENETVNEIAFTAGGKGAEYSLYLADSEDGILVTDEESWQLVKEGVLSYSGYHTVKISGISVTGEKAVILRLSGEELMIGVEESLTKSTGYVKYFSVLSEHSFTLQNGMFVRAERERNENGFTYTEGYDVSLRIYTDGK